MRGGKEDDKCVRNESNCVFSKCQKKRNAFTKPEERNA